MRKTIFSALFIILIGTILADVVYSDDESKAGLEKKTSIISHEETYKIGSGDVLEVMTWKEPDFTRDVIVRVDGKFSFPLIGDIQSAGRTTLEVKKEIETGLKEYIEDPIVTVIVKNPQSQKFYILGEVAKTGEYFLIKDLTILQAFALAGGFTEWASKSEIILLRREGSEEKITRINYKNIVKGKELEQNVLIKANDTIIVP